MYRECPYCAEQILAKAKLCKHCQSNLEPFKSDGGSVQEQTYEKENQEEVEQSPLILKQLKFGLGLAMGSMLIILSLYAAIKISLVASAIALISAFTFFIPNTKVYADQYIFSLFKPKNQKTAKLISLFLILSMLSSEHQSASKRESNERTARHKAERIKAIKTERLKKLNAEIENFKINKQELLLAAKKELKNENYQEILNQYSYLNQEMNDPGLSAILNEASVLLEAKKEKHRQQLKELAPKICRAAIATVMGRDISIITTRSITDNIHYLYYKRPDDNSLWKYRCKPDGNNIMWASNWTESEGRWRTSQYDGKVTYKLKNELLTIDERYPDNSVTSKTFNIKKI